MKTITSEVTNAKIMQCSENINSNGGFFSEMLIVTIGNEMKNTHLIGHSGRVLWYTVFCIWWKKVKQKW